MLSGRRLGFAMVHSSGSESALGLVLVWEPELEQQMAMLSVRRLGFAMVHSLGSELVLGSVLQ